MSTKNILIISAAAIVIIGFGIIVCSQRNAGFDQVFGTTPPPAQEEPQANSMINVFSPAPNSQVVSPLTVTGEARGNWYFEASFPVKLYDANGNLLAEAPAQAQGEWMTTDFVPFSVTLTFTTPTTQTGTLVLEKDNPSGLPQNADSVTIPVSF